MQSNSDIPDEPLIIEGAVVFTKVRIKILEDESGWRLVPDLSRLVGLDIFFILFGIPFVSFMTYIISASIMQEKLNVNVYLGLIPAFIFVSIPFGTVILIARTLLHHQYGQLCGLLLPRDQNYIIYENRHLDMNKWLNNIILINRDMIPIRKQLIAKALIEAVQLCPWIVKLTKDSFSTKATQCLLVLRNTNSFEQEIQRIPMLITTDSKGAANLMEKVAKKLDVPFICGTDDEGWKLEKVRAEVREPLKYGSLVE